MENKQSKVFKSTKKIHVRLQQRNKKRNTRIEGFQNNQSPQISHKDLLSKLKNSLHCHGAVVEDEEIGKIIILDGDFRVEVCDFLVQNGLSTTEEINVPGIDLSKT
jgi:translation initiation factor SUI1